jgi:hypothetical protein
MEKKYMTKNRKINTEHPKITCERRKRKMRNSEGRLPKDPDQ